MSNLHVYVSTPPNLLFTIFCSLPFFFIHQPPHAHTIHSYINQTKSNLREGERERKRELEVANSIQVERLHWLVVSLSFCQQIYSQKGSELFSMLKFRIGLVNWMVFDFLTCRSLIQLLYPCPKYYQLQPKTLKKESIHFFVWFIGLV